ERFTFRVKLARDQPCADFAFHHAPLDDARIAASGRSVGHAAVLVEIVRGADEHLLFAVAVEINAEDLLDLYRRIAQAARFEERFHRGDVNRLLRAEDLWHTRKRIPFAADCDHSI